MNPIMLAVLLALASSDPQPLYVETSHPGETLDQFAHRIAPRARAQTMELESEICGSFQKAGEQYRIAFSTNHNVWGCNIDFVNEGEWVATRFTMHTHTAKGGHGFSATDNKLRLQGYVVSYRSITKRIGNIEVTSKL